MEKPLDAYFCVNDDVLLKRQSLNLLYEGFKTLRTEQNKISQEITSVVDCSFFLTGIREPLHSQFRMQEYYNYRINVEPRFVVRYSCKLVVTSTNEVSVT